MPQGIHVATETNGSLVPCPSGWALHFLKEKKIKWNFLTIQSKRRQCGSPSWQWSRGKKYKQNISQQQKSTDWKTADILSNRKFLMIQKPLWSPTEKKTVATVVQLGQARNSWFNQPRSGEECTFLSCMKRGHPKKVKIHFSAKKKTNKTPNPPENISALLHYKEQWCIWTNSPTPPSLFEKDTKRSTAIAFQTGVLYPFSWSISLLFTGRANVLLSFKYMLQTVFRLFGFRQSNEPQMFHWDFPPGNSWPFQMSRISNSPNLFFLHDSHEYFPSNKPLVRLL